MAVRSLHAQQLLADLLDAPPDLRNVWIRTLDPADFAKVTEAAYDALGTPFGIWQDDLVGFVEICLGETLWRKQNEVAVSLVENERTAVPSCHNAGKSHLAGRVVAWWVSVWPAGTAKCVTTASRWRQVRNQLWPHIRRVHASADLPGQCLQTQWQVGDLDYPAADGFSPDDYDETAFSGIHDPHVLVVVDEAGGLSETLGKSLESAMSGGHPRLLLIGNPPIDETGSPWFEERTEKDSYNVVRIPASETPNFTGEVTPLCAVHPDFPPHPISDHLVTPSWVETIRDDYGEEDPYYVARVLALFPKNVTGKVIPRTWLDDAAACESPDESTWVRLGVDVAADGGDEFVIARADGYTLREVHRSRGLANANPHDVAGKILEEVLVAFDVARTLGSKRAVRVKVDAIGVGWGVAGILRAWGSEGRHRAEIVPVNVARKPVKPKAQELYANQRAEMWWTGRLLSQSTKEPGSEKMLPPSWRLELDDQVLRQLSGPKYGRTSDGKILVEKKSDMLKRGVKSPDRAEAVLLAVYEPGYSGKGKVGSFDGQLPTPSAGT